MDAVGQKGVEQDLLEIKTTQTNPLNPAKASVNGLETQPLQRSRPEWSSPPALSQAFLGEDTLYGTWSREFTHQQGHARLPTFSKMKEKLQNQGRSRGVWV